MKRIGIIGGAGNMGRRYAAIISRLGREPLIIDPKIPGSDSLLAESDGYLICTPTYTHLRVIRNLMPHGKPILCEKPLSTDPGEVEEVLTEAAEMCTPLSCVGQYRHLAPARASGPSHYNYFRHGNDGLIWDCYQIVGLATGRVVLAEDSPIWDCMINGVKLDISKMDKAYITEIESFVTQNSTMSSTDIIEWHRKTHRMYLNARYCIDWNPGPQY